MISTQAELIVHALALRADARQPALVRRLEFGGPVDLLAGAAGALYPEGFVVELSDGDYKLERAPDAVGGYCILRYTPGPPGYVSIVVVKRVGADDPPGRSCCAHSPDEALLPSKPSSETLLEM